MEESEVLVTISGAALSNLLFENARSKGSQIGFLMGQVLIFKSRKVTDSKEIDHTKLHIDVQSIVPTTWEEILVEEAKNKVDEEKLWKLLQNKRQRVIGWFNYRRETELTPMLFDKTLHNSFKQLFSKVNQKSQDYFIMCLLTTSVSDNRGMHTHRHVFFRQKKGKFEPLSLRIKNLGHDPTRIEGTEYKAKPCLGTADEVDGFSKLVKSMQDSSSSDVYSRIKNLQNAATGDFTSMIPQLQKSDREVTKWEEKLNDIKSEIHRETFNNKLLEQNKEIKVEECEIIDEPKSSPMRRHHSNMY